MEQLNFNLYRVFYEAANCGSFCEASEKLYISQPAISKSIKKLEDLLQVQLFHRGSNGIELTADGKKLLLYIDSAYNLILTGEKALTESRNLSHGTITIGAPSHIASFYLLDYIQRFHNDYPDIIVKVVSLSTNEMIKELQQHRIDFIVDNSPIDSIYNNLQIEYLTSFENCFICSKDSKLDIKNIIDLDNVKFVLPLKRSSTRKLLENYLKEFNVEVSSVLEVETSELIVSAVKRDIGIGYVIRKIVESDLKKKSIKEIKLNCELPRLDINLVYIKDYLTYIPQKFINDYIKK